MPYAGKFGLLPCFGPETLSSISDEYNVQPKKKKKKPLGVAGGVAGSESRSYFVLSAS